MNLQAFVIYDTKSETFTQPMFFLNSGVLMRTIADTISDENHHFSKHPEDFQVFSVGDYDDQTGVFNSTQPKHMFNLLNFKGE